METNKRYNWPFLMSSVYQVQYLINNTPARKRITVIENAFLYVLSINYEYGYRYEKKLSTKTDKKTHPKLTLSTKTVLMLKALYYENQDTGCTYSSLVCDVLNVYCDYIINQQANTQKKLI